MINLKAFERSPHLAELRVSYRRRTSSNQKQLTMPWILLTPYTAESYLRSIWNQDTIELVEDFIIVCLNTAKEVLGWVKVETGGRDSAPVDPRVIFSIALQTASTGIILAHNHPCRSPNPSQEDMAITNRLKEIGKLLSIEVLDHIVLTKENAFSFLDHGML